MNKLSTSLGPLSVVILFSVRRELTKEKKKAYILREDKPYWDLRVKFLAPTAFGGKCCASWQFKTLQCRSISYKTHRIFFFRTNFKNWKQLSLNLIILTYTVEKNWPEAQN